eukprot:12917134-Prorocentrum_lima.AAC.1
MCILCVDEVSALGFDGRRGGGTALTTGGTTEIGVAGITLYPGTAEAAQVSRVPPPCGICGTRSQISYDEAARAEK